MMDEYTVYCKVDDFWKGYAKSWYKKQLQSKKRKRLRKSKLSKSEIMTLLILFHTSHYRNLKQFYLEFACKYLTHLFPDLVSYSRFVELSKSVIEPLFYFMRSYKYKESGTYFVDSTSLAVCHNRRIFAHKTFKGLADRGKSTMGWFFGFKLHLIINEIGEILSFALTKASIDDRVPVPSLSKGIKGKLYGDKGYISSKLTQQLNKKGVHLITGIRKNMKNKLLPLYDKLMLKKRFIIETVNGQLKEVSQIQHTRHRSPSQFVVNLLAGLIAYQFKPIKPSIKSPFLSVS